MKRGLEPGAGVERFIRGTTAPQITSPEQADALIRRYREAYPRIADFWKSTSLGSLMDRPAPRIRR